MDNAAQTTQPTGKNSQKLNKPVKVANEYFWKYEIVMQKLKINQRGLSHLLLPILVILLVAIAGTFILVKSHAATPRCVGKVCRYTQNQKRQFAAAAWTYWSDPERLRQARQAKYANIYDITSKQVKCKPSKVKIIYYTDLNDQGIAWAGLHGAVKQRAGQNGFTHTTATEFNQKYYCKIKFNFAYQSQIEQPGYACAVFIHEYGHLLGREHNNDPQSPMYTGYVQGKNGSESFDQSISHTLDKTVCRESGNASTPNGVKP